jgi:hypothetical protein
VNTRHLVLALLAGIAVLVILFPWGGGTASDPPTCFGLFWYPVPCGGWPPFVAGAVTALLVGLILSRTARRD